MNEEEKETITCTNCGKEISKVAKVGNAPALSCPACGKWISKDKIPKDFPVEHREPKTEKESETIEEVEEQEESPGILRKQKDPHQILNDVLEENDISKDARAKLVRKCKRMPKPMHPDYLQTLLTKIKGGVKQIADAQLIADDYRWSLEEAEQDYSDLLSRDQRRMRTEPRKTVGQEQMTRTDKLEKKLERLRKKNFEAEKERIKQINQLKQDMMRNQMENLKDQMRSMQQQFQQQLNQLQDRQPRSNSDYKSDEFRVIGESINRLANVVQNKNIVDKVISATERLAQMPKGRPKQERREVEESESSKSNVPLLMERTGGESLVEEGEAE